MPNSIKNKVIYDKISLIGEIPPELFNVTPQLKCLTIVTKFPDQKSPTFYLFVVFHDIENVIL